MPKARQSIYPTQRKTHFWIVFAAAVLGVLVVFVTLWAARKSLCSGDVFHLYVTIAVWAIAPPVWFWFEYFTVYLRWGKPESFDLFKYGQQVAAAIWAGSCDAGLCGQRALDLKRACSRRSGARACAV
jgi:4-hydroxybenzoate polyprenyltransferase